MIEAGTLVILCNGIYSDKYNIGIAKILVPFDDAYIESTGLRAEKLQQHLVDNGYIEVFDGCIELWLAEDSRSLDWGKPRFSI